ncbi:MAG: class I SAM-dependent methyltransferase [Lachnospiraceae bacterium]|nr:class I SAM-dependent methyltransferase [Lachnospiraceae bacterium]
MLQTEMIGRVAMNYKHYTGADLYSDGAVEDELLNIVINHHPSEYGEIIEKHASWPIFYHLSEKRGNIVEWVPIQPGAKVLEVGSGCGAVTSALSAKGVQLTCVELSKKRSLINAHRNRERDGITIHVGNFRDIEPELDRDFSYIFLIGVLEYGASYIGGDRPFESFLYMLQRHLAPGGRIIIAIENRLGLKYFAGCKEDHAARYYTGIEGYAPEDPARTFSRATLERLIRNAGISEYHFYYPYPDYKFMTMLHSDQYLPREGEFSDHVYNFDNDRLILFNEKRAFDSLIRDRMYPEFANSFEVVIGPPIPTIFVKYSNDRADDFKIRTDIALDMLGRMQIRKYPLTLAAKEHVRSMSDAYTTLTDRYRGGDIAVNDCQLDELSDAAIFSFVNGVQLSTLMDACIAKGDLAEFDALFREYLRRISYREDYPAADFDLIFSNILVNGPVWTIIDYEWTYGKRIATREIAFRALYCYVLEDEKRRVINVDKYYAELGLDAAEIAQLMREEEGFQKYVTGGRKSLVEMRNLLGFACVVPDQISAPQIVTEQSIQLYFDRGNGFSEEDSVFPNIRYDKDGNAQMQIRFENGMKQVRLDPAMAPCIVTIKRVEWNGKAINDDNAPVAVQPNGAWLSDDSIVFHTADPNITFTPDKKELSDRRGNILTVQIGMIRIPADMADNLYTYQMEAPEEELQVMSAPPAPAPFITTTGGGTEDAPAAKKDPETLASLPFSAGSDEEAYEEDYEEDYEEAYEEEYEDEEDGDYDDEEVADRESVPVRDKRRREIMPSPEESARRRRRSNRAESAERERSRRYFFEEEEEEDDDLYDDDIDIEDDEGFDAFEDYDDGEDVRESRTKSRRQRKRR